jgi:hypothetical protein
MTPFQKKGTEAAGAARNFLINMTEQSRYQVSEEAKKFIKQAFTDGIGDALRDRAARSHDPQVVPAQERRIQLLQKAASGVPFLQIAAETKRQEAQVYEQYRSALIDLWNQSPKKTQEGFTKQVFTPPKRDKET